MRLLILATTKFAPTYNSKLVSQVKYFNSFANRKADILVDASLLEIENILNKSTYDLIYPTTVFEYNNEGTSITSFNSYLYKLLDYYKQEYIGSSLFSHLLLNDNALTNFKSGVGLPNKVITRHAWQNNKEMILEQLESFQLPAIIKPNTLAASLGIDESSIVRDRKDFAQIIDNCLKKFDCLSEVLVEYYLENCIEYTVSVTGNSGRYLFNVSKLLPKTKIHPIHSFQSKNMLAEQREFTYTIEENNIIQYKLQRLSEKMFEKMNLRDIARFDYLQTSNGDFYLIDANSLPSLSNNYIFEYTRTGKIRLEQLLMLISLVAEKRIGMNIPFELFNEYPVEVVRALF